MDSTGHPTCSNTLVKNPGPDRNWSDMVVSLFSNSEGYSEPWWCQSELLRKENMEEVANTLVDPPSALENGGMFPNGTQQTTQQNKLPGTFYPPRSLENFNADREDVQWKIGELSIPFNDTYQKMQIFVPYQNGVPTFLKDATSEEKASDINSAKVELKSENLNFNNAKNDNGVANDINSVKVELKSENLKFNNAKNDNGVANDIKAVKVELKSENLNFNTAKNDNEVANDINSVKVELKSENLNFNNAKNDNEIGQDIKADLKPEKTEQKTSNNADTENAPYEQNNPTPPETENIDTAIPTQSSGRRKKQDLTTKIDTSYDDRNGLAWETKLTGPQFSVFAAFDPVMIITDDKNESLPPNLGLPLKPGPYKFVCEYCLCGFHQFYKYKNHVVIHQGQRLHKCRCDRCGIPYRDYRTMSKNHNAAYKPGPN